MLCVTRKGTFRGEMTLPVHMHLSFDLWTLRYMESDNRRRFHFVFIVQANATFSSVSAKNLELIVLMARFLELFLIYSTISDCVANILKYQPFEKNLMVVAFLCKNSFCL